MNQQVIETVKVAEVLTEIFEKEQTKKAMLVCDAAFSFLQTKEEYLKLPVPYVMFDKFTPHPRIRDLV